MLGMLGRAEGVNSTEQMDTEKQIENRISAKEFKQVEMIRVRNCTVKRFPD